MKDDLKDVLTRLVLNQESDYPKPRLRRTLLREILVEMVVVEQRPLVFSVR